MITRTRCTVCNGEVYRNARGQILAHTTAASGGRSPNGYSSKRYQPAEFCSGSTPGARP